MIQDQRVNDSPVVWIVFMVGFLVAAAIYIFTALGPEPGRIACEERGGTWIVPPGDIVVGEDSNPHCSVPPEPLFIDY